MASYIYETPFGDTIADNAKAMKDIIEVKKEELTNSDVVITKVVTRKMIKSLDETLELYKSRAVEFTEEEFETLSEFYSYLKQVLDYSKELHSLVNSDNSKWIDGMKEDTYYTEKMFSSFSTYK